MLNNASDNNIKIYKTAGSSMQPFFQENDILIVKKVPPEFLRIGDIIAFNDGGQSGTVHRLVNKIKIADGTILFQTKGDANRFFDAPIPKEAIIGKVYFVERMNKFCANHLINIDTCGRRTASYLIARRHYFLGNIFHILRYCKRKVRAVLRCLNCRQT